MQDEEIEGLLSTWKKLKVTVSFEKFVHFDDSVATVGTFSVEEIIQSTKTDQHNSDNDREEWEIISCRIIE
jgi:hypothetical protein